jgi:D-lactate dehydrogenase
MNFMLNELRNLVGDEHLLTETQEVAPYCHDTSRYQGQTSAVVLAASTEMIIQVVQFCYHHGIAIYTRGYGTGTTGGCVPIQDGIVLSLERMNRILDMDEANRVMTVEPGVLNQTVQDKAREHGFFWAPDPASAQWCSVGGNLACNSAGPRAVKYGTCRENTLGLSAVTGAGRLLKTGVYTTKGVVGYDLTRLFIGSEASLGVITQAQLKLLPLAENKVTLRLIYNDLTQCSQAITRIMAQSITPCALEFMDEQAINMIRDDTNLGIPRQAQALLMVEIDGPTKALKEAAQQILRAGHNRGLIEQKTATDPAEQQALWQMRKSLSPALKKVAPTKINEDIVVPISKLPEFISYTHELTQPLDITLVNFGHAGNGNIHVNLMFDEKDSKQSQQAKDCLRKIFSKVIALNGTLSGEHGVGIDKRAFIAEELDATALDYMR